MIDDGPVCVYALRDPRTMTWRYIGMTSSPFDRWHAHLKAYGDTHKDRWIQLLEQDGHEPLFEIIEWFGTRREAQVSEKHWIELLRFLGPDQLTNMHSGGQYHPIGPAPKSAGQKISAALTGRTLSTSHKRSIQVALLGKPKTAAHIKAAAKGQTGRKHSAAHREANRRARLGKKPSLETRTKRGVACKAAWRKKKPSTSQLQLLRKYGLPIHEGMTHGDASDMIGTVKS